MRMLSWIFVAVAVIGISAAQAQDKGQSLRPEVGKPIQAAIDLLKSKRGKEALARAREAQAVDHKTTY